MCFNLKRFLKGKQRVCISWKKKHLTFQYSYGNAILKTTQNCLYFKFFAYLRNASECSCLHSLAFFYLKDHWFWRILHFALHKMLKGQLALAFYSSFFICVCLEVYVIVNDKPSLLKNSHPVEISPTSTLILMTGSQTRTFILILTRVFQNHFNYWNEKFAQL